MTTAYLEDLPEDEDWIKRIGRGDIVQNDDGTWGRVNDGGVAKHLKGEHDQKSHSRTEARPIAKFNPYHDRLGQFTSGPSKATVEGNVSVTMQAIRDEPYGFSIDDDTHMSPMVGVCVSLHPELERIYEPGEISEHAVKEWLSDPKVVNALRGQDRVIGGWVGPDGRTYLDVTTIEANVKRAVEAGRTKNQLAVFDLAAMEEIPTGVVRKGIETGTRHHRWLFAPGTDPGAIARTLGSSVTKASTYLTQHNVTNNPHGGRFVRAGTGAGAKRKTLGDYDFVERCGDGFEFGDYYVTKWDNHNTEYNSHMTVREQGSDATVGTIEWSRSMNSATGNREVRFEHMGLAGEAQGTGFAQAYMSHVLGNLKEAGVKKVTLEANIDVGGYAWARMGARFKSGDKDALLSWWSSNSSGQDWMFEYQRTSKKEYREDVKTAWRMLKKGTLMNDIAMIGRPAVTGGRDDMWFGKALLLGKTYEAYFDLAEVIP